MDKEEIKEARIKAGLTQAEFSREFGIPLDSVKSWDAGRRKPPAWAGKLILNELRRKGNMHNYVCIIKYKDPSADPDIEFFEEEEDALDYADNFWGSLSHRPDDQEKVESCRVYGNILWDSDEPPEPAPEVKYLCIDETHGETMEFGSLSEAVEYGEGLTADYAGDGEMVQVRVVRTAGPDEETVWDPFGGISL